MSITYGGSSITFPDNSTQNTAFKVGMINRLMNGDMRIDQRSAGASFTPNNNYCIDRWVCGNSQTSKFTVQQSSTAPSGFKYSAKITSSSAYSIGSGDYFSFGQRIEGYNVADLGFGTADATQFTISFWIRSSLTGTFGAAIQNGNYDRSYPFSYTISAADTWEKKTITITADTSGTWDTTNGRGLVLTFSLGYGSSYSSSSNSWQAGNYGSVTGATSVVGTSGATWYVTGVQLEKGSTATSFDYRFYGHELDLCQRYYEYGGVSTRHYIYASGTGRYAGIRVDFKQEKRVAPSISLANGYTTDGWGSYSVESHNSPTGATNTLKSFTVNCASSQTDNSLAIIACTWTASAEL